MSGIIHKDNPRHPEHKDSIARAKKREDAEKLSKEQADKLAANKIPKPEPEPVPVKTKVPERKTTE
jgi:hypothetical protein